MIIRMSGFPDSNLASGITGSGVFNYPIPTFIGGPNITYGFEFYNDGTTTQTAITDSPLDSSGYTTVYGATVNHDIPIVDGYGSVTLEPGASYSVVVNYIPPATNDDVLLGGPYNGADSFADYDVPVFYVNQMTITVWGEPINSGLDITDVFVGSGVGGSFVADYELLTDYIYWNMNDDPDTVKVVKFTVTNNTGVARNLHTYSLIGLSGLTFTPDGFGITLEDGESQVFYCEIDLDVMGPNANTQIINVSWIEGSFPFESYSPNLVANIFIVGRYYNPPSIVGQYFKDGVAITEDAAYQYPHFLSFEYRFTLTLPDDWALGSNNTRILYYALPRATGGRLWLQRLDGPDGAFLGEYYPFISGQSVALTLSPGETYYFKVINADLDSSLEPVPGTLAEQVGSAYSSYSTDSFVMVQAFDSGDLSLNQFAKIDPGTTITWTRPRLVASGSVVAETEIGVAVDTYLPVDNIGNATGVITSKVFATGFQSSFVNDDLTLISGTIPVGGGSLVTRWNPNSSSGYISSREDGPPDGCFRRIWSNYFSYFYSEFPTVSAGNWYGLGIEETLSSYSLTILMPFTVDLNGTVYNTSSYHTRDVSFTALVAGWFGSYDGTIDFGNGVVIGLDDPYPTPYSGNFWYNYPPSLYGNNANGYAQYFYPGSRRRFTATITLTDERGRVAVDTFDILFYGNIGWKIGYI